MQGAPDLQLGAVLACLAAGVVGAVVVSRRARAALPRSITLGWDESVLLDDVRPTFGESLKDVGLTAGCVVLLGLVSALIADLREHGVAEIGLAVFVLALGVGVVTPWMRVLVGSRRSVRRRTWQIQRAICTDEPTRRTDPRPRTAASDPAGCSGTLSHRSTQYDVLRYLWDLYTDQSVPFSAIVDIVDDADPHDWNATHDALNPNDDPEKRWADAALANGSFTQHLAEDHNGMDH